MVRKYKRTGVPVGRPRKLRMDPVKLEAARTAIDNMTSRAMGVSGPDLVEFIATPLDEAQRAAFPDKAKWDLAAIVHGFHPKVPELLGRLATWEPDKALKFYLELMEFQIPKLARTEVTGAIDMRHQSFVAVEQRDEGPIALEKQADGSFA